MKFFLQDNTSDQIDKIIKALNKLMDGDVSHQMKQKGLEYKLNYGASILWLRNLAKKHQGNNELANRLWHREIRETMILATLIIIPDEQDYSNIMEWIDTIPTNEIAEQLGTNTLWKLHSLVTVSQDLLQSSNSLKQAAAWVGLATYLQKGFSIDTKEVKTFLNYIKPSTNADSNFMQRVKGRFLRQLCRASDTYIEWIEELLNELQMQNTSNYLIEDVKTEIQFLKEK